MPRLVLIFGRDPTELSAKEVRAIHRNFGEDVKLERIDAKDSASYAAECAARKPAMVLLPEKPVYHAALGKTLHLSLYDEVGYRLELKQVLGMNYRFGFAHPYTADLSKAGYWNFPDP